MFTMPINIKPSSVIDIESPWVFYNFHDYAINSGDTTPSNNAWGTGAVSGLEALTTTGSPSWTASTGSISFGNNANSGAGSHYYTLALSSSGGPNWVSAFSLNGLQAAVFWMNITWLPGTTFRGNYSAATDYAVDDVVNSSGTLYICIQINGPATVVKATSDAAYWTAIGVHCIFQVGNQNSASATQGFKIMANGNSGSSTGGRFECRYQGNTHTADQTAHPNTSAIVPGVETTVAFIFNLATQQVTFYQDGNQSGSVSNMASSPSTVTINSSTNSKVHFGVAQEGGSTEKSYRGYLRRFGYVKLTAVPTNIADIVKEITNSKRKGFPGYLSNGL